MNNLLLPLQFINGILSKITFFIAMAIVCVMVLALSASALTRYISGHGFDWFIELPPALVSWLVFPMLGPLLKTGNHIEVDFSSNTAVIMGSEEHGIRKKTKEICDQLVRLSSNKDFKSFNVSVATGIILSEISRQRKC